MAEVQITGETLDNLAQKLETFSEDLSPEERTTLQAMLVLAGQKIADADEVAGFAFGGSPFAARKQCQRRWHGPAPAGILQLVRVVHGQRCPWLAGRRRHRFGHGVHRVDADRSSASGSRRCVAGRVPADRPFQQRDSETWRLRTYRAVP